MNHAPDPPWAKGGTETSCDSLGLAIRVFFRCSSPRLILLLTLLPLAARVVVGQWTWWDLAVVAGMVPLWALQEHQAHQHLLHMKPFTWFDRRFDLYMARRHRAHHKEPWLLGMTLLPPEVPVVAFVASCALWWAVMPTLPLALTAITAYSAHALAYEWTHYLTHVPYVPRGAYYRRICRAHRWHHFKNEHYWHAFTIPWVDDVFGTNPDPSSVDKSETVRTLGVEDTQPAL